MMPKQEHGAQSHRYIHTPVCPLTRPDSPARGGGRIGESLPHAVSSFGACGPKVRGVGVPVRPTLRLRTRATASISGIRRSTAATAHGGARSAPPTLQPIRCVSPVTHTRSISMATGGDIKFTSSEQVLKSYRN